LKTYIKISKQVWLKFEKNKTFCPSRHLMLKEFFENETNRNGEYLTDITNFLTL